MAEQMLAEVEYRYIPGFDLYQAGSDGTIWSWNNNGHGRRSYPKQLKSVFDPHSGYCVTRVVKREYVHRLVLMAFCGECLNVAPELNDKFPPRASRRLSDRRWSTVAKKE